MVSTVLAVAAANILLASVLARLFARGRVLEFGPLGVALLVGATAVFAWLAFIGWRGYLRRRRPS
jgi:hypothetical protein